MRVLLSAYACEPNRGSEQEVGWQRAMHMLAFADEVWVLTRANNREVIEADPASQTSGLHFIYYDLPGWAQSLKKRSWLLYLYVIFWQWGAYAVAAEHHRKEKFDWVYHVTFVSMQFGSRMGQLGIPFMIGPIAGGERAPFRLRRSMPWRGWVSELLRDIGILLQRYSPLARPAFAAAERIFVATPESLRLVPSKWRYKTGIHLAVAIDPLPTSHGRQHRGSSAASFVFVGRLLHWKGVHFAIRALAQVKQSVPDATLTVFGIGPEEARLRGLASQLGIANAVNFAGHAPRKQLIESFQNHAALVFPSLHDSGGLAVLEALSQGLPVVCLDLGGPGSIVNKSCGMVVRTTGADEAQIVTSIADGMKAIVTMPTAARDNLAAGAVSRSNELSWVGLTERVVGFQPD